MVSLAEIIKQTKNNSANRNLFEDDPSASKEQQLLKTQKQFAWFANALDKYGEYSGTGHKRILIPKSIISEEELEQLGFLGVNIAIPEAGQETQTSFRHMEEKYHLHDFRDMWTLHEDKHHSSTMLIEKARRTGKDSMFGAIAKTVQGLPHVITEGVPGLYYYAKGQVGGTARSMKERLVEELPEEYLDIIDEYNTSISAALSKRTDQLTTEIGGINPLIGGGIAGGLALLGVGLYGAGFKGLGKIGGITGLAAGGIFAGRVAIRRYGNSKLKSNTAVDSISGRDDEYNIIEGLRHGGMAETTRKELTNFGSGWRGMLGKIFGAFAKEKPASISTLLKERGIKVAGSIEEYVGAVAGKGVSPEVVKSQAERLRLAGPLSFVEGKVVFAGNEKVFSYDVLKAGGAKYGSSEYKRQTRVLKDISLFHEISEVKYGEYVHKAFGKDPEKLLKLKFGTHWSPQVIKEEAMFAKSLGKRGVEVARLLRKSEGIDITKAVSREELANTVQELRKLGKQARKVPNEEVFAQYRAVKDRYYKQKVGRIYNDILQDTRRPIRMEKFRKVSTDAVGIGHRAAHNAGRKHSKFSSTISG